MRVGELRRASAPGLASTTRALSRGSPSYSAPRASAFELDDIAELVRPLEGFPGPGSLRPLVAEVVSPLLG